MYLLGLYFHMLFIIEESQGWNSNKPGTWEQEFMQRLWYGAANRLAPHRLLSLIFYRNQDHQTRFDTNHSELGRPL